MNLMIKLLVLCFRLLETTCSCDSVTIKHNFQSADMVFVGRIVGLDTIKTYFNNPPQEAYIKLVKVTVLTERLFKGGKFQKLNLIVTDLSSGMCGIRFTNGSSYVFYAQKD